MDELNKKLAEWWYPEGKLLGHVPATGDILWGIKNRQEWVNFPHSLDACFRWLVPKLDSLFGIEFRRLLEPKWAVTLSFYTIPPIIEFGNTPALVLCQAIEKLIDSEVENG